MSERKPEAWESAAPGPFITMRRERGVASIEALGQQRFRVRAEGHIMHDEIVAGYDPAHALLRELAERLGPRRR